MNAKKIARKRRLPCIELDARLTIVEAHAVHALLLKRLTSGDPIVVDGSRVEQVDTAILQLLTSLWRTAAARGISCAWRGASSPLRATATLLGLAEVLELHSSETVSA